MDNIYTLTELICKAKQHPHSDKIDQLLSEVGYMIVGSNRGDGKTLEMLHLLCAFASKDGGNYHGLAVKPCFAFYINLEDDETKIGERLEIIKAQYDLAYEPQVKFADNLYLDTLDGQRELENIIAYLRGNNYKVEVIIIDNLKYTISGDYTKPNCGKRWADNVKALSKRLGVAFIFPHHTRKLIYYQGKKEDLLSSDRLKGAGDLIDHAESGLLLATENKVERDGESLKRVKKNTLVVVKARHAIVNLEELPLQLNLDRKRLCWNGQHWEHNENEIKIIQTKLEGN